MSEPPPPPWQPPDAPPPPPANVPPPPPGTWNYQSPMQSGGGPSIPFWGQAGFGCLSFFVAVGMAFTLMSIAASVVPDSAGAIFGVLVIPLAALLAAVIVFRTRFGWRGFLPGILIAFGLVALLVGACFAIIMVSMSGSSMH